MVDLGKNTISKLFQQQVMELTQRTVMPIEDSFDYQFSGGWLR
jgi:hypothetical protein